jgi:hypothetical protein
LTESNTSIVNIKSTLPPESKRKNSVGFVEQGRTNQLYIQYSLSATQMPLHFTPLVAVRWQWGQRIFSAATATQGSGSLGGESGWGSVGVEVMLLL